MKRIEFLAPVEAMRGNLSGDQVLVYKDGKRAYDVTGVEPVTAQNYDNRYIGSKRSINGKKFFSLKSKSTTNLGTDSRLAMAAFGGSCSVAKNAMADLTLIGTLQNIYLAKRQAGLIPAGRLVRNWVQTEVYPMIKNKQASVTISQGTYTVTINNPWVNGGTGKDITIPADLKTKFNSVLS